MSKYIVTLKTAAYSSDEDARTAIEAAGGQIIRKFSLGMFYEVAGELAQLQTVPDCLSIEEISNDRKVKLTALNVDHLKYTVDPTASTVFDPKYTGAGVDVFLVDTGINKNHVEFAESSINDLYSKFVDENSVPDFTDSVGHGTGMASLIVGKNIGVAKNAQLHVVRLFEDALGEATIGDIMLAFDQIHQYHINTSTDKLSVLCLPWTTDYSETINIAVLSLMADGIISVCAAGNDGLDISIKSPASVTTAITVGAFNRNLEVSSFMNTPWDNTTSESSFVNYGAALDIFALGIDVSVAAKDSVDVYLTASGTSISTAIAAGALAHYIEWYPEHNSAEIRETFLSEGHFVGARNLIFDQQNPNIDYAQVYPAMVTVENADQFSLTEIPSGRAINIKAGESVSTNLQFHPDATDIEILNFAPLPKWASLDIASGMLSADTANLTAEQVPGLYMFAVKGSVNGDILVEEFSIGIYQTDLAELQSEDADVPAFYYDIENDQYDQVISYALSKN